MPSDSKWLQVIVNGTLLVASGLHVSHGRKGRDRDARAEFVRDPKGRPFIPGSTLKGALRAQAETGIRTSREHQKAPIWACDFPASLDNEALSFCLRSPGASKPCAVCGLFGSTANPSRLFVRDLDLAQEWSEPLMQVRSTLGISRGLGRGIESSARHLESLPPGLEFRFELLASEPSRWELGLLFWALNRLDKGFGRVGGGKRLGLGLVKFQLEHIAVQKLASGLGIESDVYLPTSEAKMTDEGAQADVETQLGIPKPAPENVEAVLYYCLKLTERDHLQADAGEVGKLLSSEFGLGKKRRKELGLPEKVSELLDELVSEKKLGKNYLGQYNILPGYTVDTAPEKGKEAAAGQETGLLCLEEFTADCIQALRELLLPRDEPERDA